MHLVAIVDGGSPISEALRSFRDGAGRFHLHSVPPGSTGELLTSLKRLEYAGALVVPERAQAEVQRAADRSSLDAEELGAADTLTVTPAGIVADHTFGRAVSSLLTERRWDAAGASAVVLGASTEGRAVMRELVRLGVGSLSVLAADRVAAEQALPRAVSTTVTARSLADPVATTLIEHADLLVRVDGSAEVDDGLLGPHLTVIDLAPGGGSNLRRRAIELGALTFARHELVAHQFQISLSQLLGGPVSGEPFRTLFRTP